MYRIFVLVALIAFFPLASALSQATQEQSGEVESLFHTSDNCMACHNGLITPSGEDVSIGSDWRASMMANSARDPYWQAAVRREILDHPESREAIEDECSKCHMPMTRFAANAAGGKGVIFAHLPAGAGANPADQFAIDGVSCSVCHQITAENLGTAESFVGRFSVDTTNPPEERTIFGPFEIERGQSTIMHSATGFTPTRAGQVQMSEMCATCHTLITHALDPRGEVLGELPEQMPYQEYLEWEFSAYRTQNSCQDCHLPTVEQPIPIAAVLGEPREGFSRHDFRGGNFFILNMLNRYRTELAVEALSQELELAAQRAKTHLQSESSMLTIDRAEIRDGMLEIEVSVANLAGHKFPTAYPSRRVWLQLTARDGSGQIVFESGAFNANGSIQGNDNDADPTRYEPHYDVIRSSEEVQIYESVMADQFGRITTGLLSGLGYVKDNRLLPLGFDKTMAEEAIAVLGNAMTDEDFLGGSDTVRYILDVAAGQGPFVVEAALWYQPIGYRWAENLKAYDSLETNRFVSYYEAMAATSAIIIARSRMTAQ
jgi:hypothetical protein